MESDHAANQANNPNEPEARTQIGGNVYTSGGDFVGRDKVQYIVNSLDDVPLSLEEMNSLLARYRQRLAEETRYIKLEGIPLPDTNFVGAIPIQRVYIHIQALEQQQSQEVRRAEEQAMLEAATAAKKERAQPNLFDLISRLGEYLYRRGESVESSQRPAPIDPLEAIGKHQHLVLLGAPGSGKSTLLRYVAHQAAADEQGKLPLLVPLGAFALAYRQNRQLSLFEWAFSHVAPDDDQLQRALRQHAAINEVLWLFDGLDEAGDLREESSRQISKAIDRAQVIVTSRPLDYRRTYLERFTHFEVLPLTTANVEQFITDWLTILAEQQDKTQDWVEECSAWLKQQLAARPRLRALTQTPLLLTFLVILARHDPRQDLPTRRSDLYRRYIEELFSAWEKRRRSDALPLPQGRYIWGIEAIAWYLHLAYFGRTQTPTATKGQNVEAYEPNRTNLQNRLASVLYQEGYAIQRAAAEQIADQIIEFWIGTGLLEEQQWKHWKLITFRHLTFQEYGVANVLQAGWHKDPDRTWCFVRPRLHHLAWREPLLLLAEQMDSSAIDSLLQHLLCHPSPYDHTLQRDLYLAATLAGENSQASARIMRQIVNRLSRLIRSHNLLLGFTGLLTWVLIFAVGWIVAWLVHMPPILSCLSGFGTFTVLIFAFHSRKVRFFLVLPMRSWRMNARSHTNAVSALSQLGDIAVEPLLVALQDDDVAVRLQIIHALGQLGDGRAVQPLLTTLKDENDAVRSQAFEALGQLGDKRAVEPLLTARHDYAVHSQVIEVLGRLGNMAVDPLLATLQDDNATVDSQVIEVLGRLGDRRAVEPLLALLNDEKDYVRLQVIEALGRLGDRRAVELLITALQDKNGHISWMAALALGRLGDIAVEPLLATLQDEDDAVRLQTVEALDKLGDRRAVELLLIALQNDNDAVRLQTVKALDKLGDRRAVEPLLIALQDKNDAVRLQVIATLGQLGDRRAVQPLLAVLHDGNNDIRWGIVEALGQLRARQAIKQLIVALKDKNDTMRWHAVEALGELGDGQAVEPLIAALKDENDTVCWHAVEALGKLEDRRAVEPLIAALKDENDTVRWHAVGALGQLGDRRAVEPLITALKDENDTVRWHAVGALGQLGDGQAVEPLIAALKDENDTMRWHAVGALGQLGDKRAVEPLIAALKDENDTVRWHAVGALGQLGDKRAVEPLIAAFKDEDSDVRKKATQALIQLGDIAWDLLITALKDENDYVLWQAAATLEQLSDRHAIDWDHKMFKQIASALWWRIIDDFFKQDERIFKALSAIVNRFPITASIDDLLLPSKTVSITLWRQPHWWFGTVLAAILAVALAGITGVLGNLLTQWWDIPAIQGTRLVIAIIIVTALAVLLVILSQFRRKE